MSGTSVVSVAGDSVIVNRLGTSMPIEAKILGKVRTGNSEMIYLDRLVHQIGEKEIGDYVVSGAISTILTHK